MDILTKNRNHPHWKSGYAANLAGVCHLETIRSHPIEYRQGWLAAELDSIEEEED